MNPKKQIPAWGGGAGAPGANVTNSSRAYAEMLILNITLNKGLLDRAVADGGHECVGFEDSSPPPRRCESIKGGMMTELTRWGRGERSE